VPFKWNAFHPNGGPQQKSKPGAEFEEWRGEPDRAKSSEARPAIGGPITSQTYEETEIQKAIAWFTSYLVSERESYFTVGQPLHGEWRESMDGFFEAALLDQVRVVELAERRVANPWFYPAAREKGSAAFTRHHAQGGRHLFGRRRVQRKNHQSGSIPWPGACGAGKGARRPRLQ